MEELPKNEIPEAISFAENYFALVDGLIPGLEKYLAKDIVLNWFGHIVKGKRKVIAFLENYKLATRHVFTNILPINCIVYKTPTSSPKSKRNTEFNNNKDKCKTENNQLQHESITHCECNASMPEVGKSESIKEEKTDCDELNEDDLNALSKLDVTESNAVKMEHGANEIKQEEMTSEAKNVKMECGHGDDPEMNQEKIVFPLKHIEANGEIEFSKKTCKKRGIKINSLYMKANQVWKKACKLQISYSTGRKELNRGFKSIIKTQKPRFSELQPSKLLSLEEISALSSHLVPDTDHFGGYLRETNFFADRNNFLEKFESELKSKGEDSFSLQYRKNRPILKKVKAEQETADEFVFHYSIHFIVYEGTDTSMQDLSSEIQKLNI